MDGGPATLEGVAKLQSMPALQTNPRIGRAPHVRVSLLHMYLERGEGVASPLLGGHEHLGEF